MSVDRTTALVELCERTVPGLVGRGSQAGQAHDAADDEPPPEPLPLPLPLEASAPPPLRATTATVAVVTAIAASFFMFFSLGEPGVPSTGWALCRGWRHQPSSPRGLVCQWTKRLVPQD